MPTIKFRCWKCHRKYAKDVAKIGQTFKCNCDYVIRIPKKDGGNCRVKTLTDYVVEAVVCGGGGALLGFCFSIFILSRLRIGSGYDGFWLVSTMTIAFGLVGFLGGERAIDWIGELIRGHERD